MATRNQPPNSRDDDKENEQRFPKARKVVGIVLVVAAWVCLYWVLPQPWREWVDWLLGEGKPYRPLWAVYLVIILLTLAVDRLPKYFQEYSKNRDGSEKNKQGTTISHKEEQRIAKAREAYKAVLDAVVGIKARILDPTLFHRMVSSGGPGDDDRLRRALENEIDDFEQKIKNALVLTDDKKFADDLRELSRLSRLIFHPIKHADSGRPAVEQKTDALETIDEHTKNCLTWLSLANTISSHVENEALGTKAAQRKKGGSVVSLLRGETD